MIGKYLLAGSVFILAACSSAQKAAKVFAPSEVGRIEATLSTDDMEGRKILTPGIEKASAFIASEMKAINLEQLDGAPNYEQSFEMIVPAIANVTGSVGSNSIKAADVYCKSTNASINVDASSNYKVLRIHSADNFFRAIRPAIMGNENTLVLADTAFANNMRALQRSNSPMFSTTSNVVVVLTPEPDATVFNIQIQQTLQTVKLNNVVGLLRGKSRPDEYVIFSGHYDHLGYSRPDSTGDSLYNGANDDASGVTAMLTLAKYYKALHNNERSIIFAAFTAEESGGFGARYFSNQLDPAKVMAMFNIEMIGTDSKWGNNSAYITGYEKTDFGKILQQNLAGTAFSFYPDPYPQQQLFYRSDNATLARLGVPAHTISTSKMDAEPNYHKPSDEYSTLDMNNMTEVIKAIAMSAQSIISGTDTPTRVNQSELSR